jgi:hypothetical protein
LTGFKEPKKKRIIFLSIRNYLKRYDNQVSLDLLDIPAILSANLIKNEAPQKSPDPVLWFGWHSGDN